MLVCSTETLDRRILPKKVKVVLEKKQRNTVEYCQKVKGNDRHDTTLPSSAIKQNLFFAWKDLEKNRKTKEYTKTILIAHTVLIKRVGRNEKTLGTSLLQFIKLSCELANY